MGMGREEKYSIKVIDLSESTTVVATTGTKTVSIQPDIGFVYEVIELGYNAPDPAGSAAGSHRIKIKNRAAYTHIIEVKGNTGSAISINAAGFVGNSAEAPANSTDQYRTMHQWLIASNSVPLDVLYVNETDVNQTGTRTCIAVVKKYREADF